MFVVAGKYAWKKLKQRMTEEDRYELQLAMAQAQAVASEKDEATKQKLANTPLKRNLVKELKDFIAFAQERYRAVFLFRACVHSIGSVVCLTSWR